MNVNTYCLICPLVTEMRMHLSSWNAGNAKLVKWPWSFNWDKLFRKLNEPKVTEEGILNLPLCFSVFQPAEWSWRSICRSSSFCSKISGHIIALTNDAQWFTVTHVTYTVYVTLKNLSDMQVFYDSSMVSGIRDVFNEEFLLVLINW